MVSMVVATHQLLAPTPIALTGEQVSPTWVVGPKTRPSRPIIRAAAGLLAVVTVLQHCIGPVVHWDGVPDGVARLASAEHIGQREAKKGVD